MPKGIIFDLDDTIISSEGTANKIWSVMCREFSTIHDINHELLYNTITKIRLDYWNEKVSNNVGRNNPLESRREIIRRVFSELDLPEDLVNAFADDYSDRRLNELKIFEGAIETLDFLVTKGIKMALITNGEAVIQRFKIDKFRLKTYFDLILIEGEQGYGKPDERLYQMVLDEFDLLPQEVWMIGDNLECDVEGPQKLGIYSIWNDFEKVGLDIESGIIPNLIVNSISELIDLI